MFFIDIFYVLLPIVGLIVNSIIQIFFLRNLNGQAYFKSIKTGFLCGAISILIFEVIFIIIKFEISINHISYLIMNFLTYALFGLCYFICINISVSAIRIRLLKELNDSFEELTLDKILIRYNSKEIINRRIKKLENNQQITCINQRYYTKKSITLFMIFVKELLSVIILRKKSRIKFNK